MRASPPGEDHIMTAMSARSKSGYDLGPLAAPERERLARGLSAEERRVLLDHGTEPPFCGGLLSNKDKGVYGCRLCGLPLFWSTTKFESGTGWPSFYEPFDADHLTSLPDRPYGMERGEIRCRRCDRRLGHVDPDRAPRAAVEQAANEAIAFEPTVVALTGVRVIGDRVLVGVLFADEAGKEMLEGLGQGGDDATDDVDVRPTKIDI